ncbi:MAG: response regulator [Desulfovibrionaceae bacterium]
MTADNSRLLEKLLQAFHQEAADRLGVLGRALVALEGMDAQTVSDGPASEVVEDVYRQFHSLKGAARTVTLHDIEAVCQAAESVLFGIKRGGIPLSRDLFDLLQRTLDTVQAHAAAVVSNTPPPAAAVTAACVAALEQVAATAHACARPESPEDAASSGESASAQVGATPVPQPQAADTRRPEGTHVMPLAALPVAPLGVAAPQKVTQREGAHSPVDGPASTVRISADRLHRLLLKTEELLAARMAADRRTAVLQDAAHNFGKWRKAWNDVGLELAMRTESGRGNGESGDKDSVTAFLDMCETRFREMDDLLQPLAQKAERDRRELSRLVDALLLDMKQALLLPFSTLLDAFPRMVRDIAQASGKEAVLHISGSDVEIDRRILAVLKDPITHILRNAIAHGIEPSAERRGQGKPAAGTISLAVSQRGRGRVQVVLTDDGAGINTDKIRAEVVRRGVLSAGQVQSMPDEELFELIYLSDFSTSSQVTDLAGRGLGMAIVREQVEKAGGFVSMRSERGTGTAFTLSVPVALTSFRGLVVETGGRLFVAPKSSVERVVRVAQRDITRLGDRDTIFLDGKPVPLAKLDALLELPQREDEEGDSRAQGCKPALIFQAGDRRIAVLVHGIVDEMDVMLKGLGVQLARVRNVAGLTLLGDGRFAPVLHVPDLLKSAGQARGAVRRTSGRVDDERVRTVLVAEDSITSRMLLKNILEVAGYRVVTAVDGLDAQNMLRREKVDLVVSDVEMPRMDGFALTEAIRADAVHFALPVVLVTSLAQREQQMRGLEVGANAYIVKSSFDQGNLLEVVSRLL